MTATTQESTAQHPAPYRHRASSILIGFILTGAPLGWLGQLILSYLLATRACFPYVAPAMLPMVHWLPPVFGIIAGLAILVSAAALVAAWRLWRVTKTEAVGTRRHALTFGEGRTRFVALVGMIVSGLFAVACVFALLAYILVPVLRLTPLILGGALAATLMVGPLDTAAARSQSGHMAQHMLLAFAAAPLLAKGELMPPLTRREAVLAWFGFVTTMIFWHLPRPFAWAITGEAIHLLENLCFLVTGYVFWSSLLRVRGHRALSDGAAVLFCASAMAIADLVGAVMSLSPRLLYMAGLCRSESVGLTQLEDQQLAGVLMWIPGTAIFLIFCATLFPAWLRQSEMQSWSRH